MMPAASTAFRLTLESISDFRRARSRSPELEASGMGKGGVVRVEGLANSSQVADGRGTEMASNETRLFDEDRRGRVGLNFMGSEFEEEVAVEEREEARARVAMVIVVVMSGLGASFRCRSDRRTKGGDEMKCEGWQSALYGVGLGGFKQTSRSCDQVAVAKRGKIESGSVCERDIWLVGGSFPSSFCFTSLRPSLYFILCS